MKYNEPQAEQRAYTIGHIIKDLIDVRSIVHKLETVKVWQDVFSEWPYEKPIVDYWIWASPHSNIKMPVSYSPLDLLGDMGGLVFIIGLIGRYVFDSCARGNLKAAAASSMYTWGNNHDKEKSGESSSLDDTSKQVDLLSKEKNYILPTSPYHVSCLGRCTRNKLVYQKYSDATRSVEADIERSLDVSVLVRRLRMHGLALRLWLDTKQR